MENKEITLRDYFAAKAMQSIISSDTMMKGIAATSKDEDSEESICKLSFRMADAMLKQRQK